MAENARVIAHNGLRLRDSPRDGETLAVLAQNDQIEVLGRETWLRVRRGNQVGFVLADHVEPVEAVEIPAPPGPPAPGANRYTRAVNIIEFSGSPAFRGSTLRVDEEFLPSLRKIEVAALAHNVTVWITSSIREPGKPVAGAVVNPTRFSNHHVGHAIDMNLIHGGRFLRSVDLGNPAGLPGPVRQFFDAVRSAPDALRWGGDFSPPDPVHIDNGLNVNNPGVFRDKLATLWGTPPQ